MINYINYENKLDDNKIEKNYYENQNSLQIISYQTKTNDNFMENHKYSIKQRINPKKRSFDETQTKYIKENGSEKNFSWSELMERRGEKYPKKLCSYDNEMFLEIDSHDKNNPNVSDYVNDIIEYYRQNEPIFHTFPNYMARQIDINENMRSILIDWIIEVHTKFKLMPETLYLTVSCIDRFLTKKKVNRSNLQLVGVTSAFIASKYEEIWAPAIKDYIYCTDQAYTSDEILDLEKVMLNSLNFHLNVPTTYFFLQQFLKITKADKDVSMLSQYLIDLSLVEYKMLKFSYSQIAASSLYIANQFLLKIEPWSNLMEQYTKYNKENLETCIKSLLELKKVASESSLKAVFKKFSGAQFNKVAKIV